MAIFGIASCVCHLNSANASLNLNDCSHDFYLSLGKYLYMRHTISELYFIGTKIITRMQIAIIYYDVKFACKIAKLSRAHISSCATEGGYWSSKDADFVL